MEMNEYNQNSARMNSSRATNSQNSTRSRTNSRSNYFGHRQRTLSWSNHPSQYNNNNNVYQSQFMFDGQRNGSVRNSYRTLRNRRGFVSQRSQSRRTTTNSSEFIVPSQNRTRNSSDSYRLATNSESDLPGFYFDPIQNRYFRILPDQHSNGPGLTMQTLAFNRMEEERLNNLNQPKQKNISENATGNLSKSFNVSELCFQQQFGSVSRDKFRRRLNETRLKNVSSKATCVLKVLEDYPSVSLERCQFIDTCSDGKTLLGCWSIRQPPWGCRIMCLDVFCDARLANEDHYGLRIEQTDNFICQLDKDVVDLCQAKMDSSVTCVLYVTVPSTERGCHVFLQPLPELSNICDPEFLGSPIYNVHWGMTEGAWSCGWEPRNMRVSLGLESCGMIFDVVSEKDFKLSSRHRNVLTQRFSKDGNLLYMGLRGNEIICCDLRRQYHRTVRSYAQNSTCWITVLNDDNYLMASNYFGEIKLWDLRQNQVVQEFKGIKNTHTKVPVILSEDESIALAVGEDGTTKGWSVKSGELLCTIPAPYPVVDRNCIPKLCYSNSWSGLSGNAAVVLGVRDELHFYELKL